MKRRSGRRNGRVMVSNAGATGVYGFTHDSTAWTITANTRM